MRCDQCGTINPPASKFCNECGTRLAQAPVQVAERRRLTVLFCDLVGSTALSEALDPEELSDVIHAYHEATTAVVRRFGGHVAQLLGDGILVYFGYPVAHEDDVRRAVRTGLAAVAAVSGLETRAGPIHARVGIHTGPVVVGEVGGEKHRERLALGETPNLAARVQGEAAPGTVAISEATLALVRPFFEVEDLGPRTLKGISTPVSIYRVIGETGVKTRMDLPGLTPIVGRTAELETLIAGWDAALRGVGRVVAVHGEAGIGKSRLLQEIKSHVSPEDGQLVLCQGSPLHGNSALYPFIEFLERLLDFKALPAHERITALSERLERTGPFPEEVLPLLGALLSLPVDREHPVFSLAPAEQRAKTIAALRDWLLRAAAARPILFMLEDAHWADPTTVELLDELVAQIPGKAILGVISYRPEFRPSWVVHEQLDEIVLGVLPPEATEAVVRHIARSKDLPVAVLEQVVARAGGIPLFVEEMTKAVLETGRLRELDDRFELVESRRSSLIPATLQDSLMARIDRLGGPKQLLQLASVIGREFSYELLRAVAERDERVLAADLGDLLDAELLFVEGEIPDATYRFKHALIRDAAYESLLRRTRQSYHLEIATALRNNFPELAEQQPALLAIHYEGAGELRLAVESLQRAGQRSTAAGAHRETIAVLEHALALLEQQPAGPDRDAQEMQIHLSIAPAYMAIKGWSHDDVTRTCNRAYQLSQTVGEREKLVPIQWGLWANYFVSGDHPRSLAAARQAHDLAHAIDSPMYQLMSYHALAASLCAHGDFEGSARLIEAGEAVFDPEREQLILAQIQLTSIGSCYGWGGLSQWFLGRYSQALSAYAKLAERVASFDHEPSEAYLHWTTSMLHAARMQPAAVLEQAELGHAVSSAHNFVFWVAVFELYLGWARLQLGVDLEHACATMERGFASWRAVAPTGVSFSHFAILVAQGRAAAGALDEALSIVDEALAQLEPSQWHYFEPQLHQVRAELLLRRRASGDIEAADQALARAAERAAELGAPGWQLRVAVSQARVWIDRGERDRARAELERALARVEASDGEVDVRAARAMLGS
ncbi:MAG TPA: adenylate/guanylate cyclase domain-containing protein [Enhygromyxa sp.]|nr:adenylate/guanylate cyclase domain-containing protein [Enhygromyxa sp.]